MSAEIGKAIEGLAARVMELARENARLSAELAQAKGLERRALSVEEIAEFLGVARSTVDRWIGLGKIPVFELPPTTEESSAKGRKYRSVRAWNTDLVAHFPVRSLASDDGEKEAG